ncbi:hypothetical protein J7J90_02315 [Candidatus Micrarchaeota archaeon]|nr:hypothetical protein [Candidatus Micrarchaeota archaeon]
MAKKDSSTSTNTKNNKTKLIIISIIVLIALGATLYLFFNNNNSPEIFFSNFIKADKVGLVVDLTNVQDNQIRQNMMNCAVDYISSMGAFIASGRLVHYEIDNNLCYYTDYGKNESEWPDTPITTSECVKEYSKYPYILIMPGDSHTFEFHQNYVVIHIGKEYNKGDCSFSIGKK